MNLKFYWLGGLMFFLFSCTNDQVQEEEQTVDQQAQAAETDMEEEKLPAYRFDHKQQLELSELEDKTKEELAMLRNEIYAYHGYRFKNEELNATFAAQGYAVNNDNVSGKLTSVDAHNLALIQSLERAHATQKAAIQLEDIEFSGEIAKEFKVFLQKLLVAANQGDTAFVRSIIHPEYSTSPGFVVNMIGQREYSSEKEKVIYAAHLCEEEYCRGCNEKVIAEPNMEFYVFGVTYEYDAAEADRDSSALYYFFVETPDGYRLYCEFAAG
ncbi:YARHG domain-containing protein [Lewinella cohaerens]|uniref:YARHG domain-containing protein n=1 Tax=Lewinella cohaerens TaxID=70995 RepID=UPI0003806142|nr:YARHG domain-containing protein [Lewinella cohaerens]